MNHKHWLVAVQADEPYRGQSAATVTSLSFYLAAALALAIVGSLNKRRLKSRP